MEKNDTRYKLNAAGFRRTNPVIFALGMFGLTIPSQMFSAYSTYFYNQEMLLSLQMISLGTVFYTIWDAFNDPLFGFLSDRTRTRFGRRKPWLLIGAPLYCLFYILFFAPPDNLRGSSMLAIYFAVFMMLTETVSTITTINYHSLFPELFSESGSRTRANALRQALQLVGMIIGVALTPMITAKIGYAKTAVLLSVLGMSLLLVSALGSHENPRFELSKQPSLGDAYKAVLSNRNFLKVSFTNFFYQATAGLLLAAIPFYVTYSLELQPAQATYLMAAVFVTAIPAMAVWGKLINRFGTLRMWRLALLLLMFSVVPMFFAQTLAAAMVAGAFIGISIAGVTANIDLINATIIDEDAAESGLRREGIYISAINFVIRFSGLARSLIFFLTTVFFGFVNAEEPGPNPGLASRYMLAVFPAALMVISVLLSRTVSFETKKVD